MKCVPPFGSIDMDANILERPRSAESDPTRTLQPESFGVHHGAMMADGHY